MEGLKGQMSDSMRFLLFFLLALLAVLVLVAIALPKIGMIGK